MFFYSFLSQSTLHKIPVTSQNFSQTWPNSALLPNVMTSCKSYGTMAEEKHEADFSVFPAKWTQLLSLITCLPIRRASASWLYLSCCGIRNNRKRRKRKGKPETPAMTRLGPSCGTQQICSNNKACFIAQAPGFPVTLDFQHPLQAQSCWCIPKGLVLSMILTTPLYFLHPMSNLVTNQTKIIYRGGQK